MIPDFNNIGLLPPYGFDGAAGIEERSPYCTTLIDFVMRFATTPERVTLLDGFIDYRTAIRETGLASGIQWIGGSFVEDCEQIRDRPPADIDVVNFLHPFGDKQEWSRIVQENIDIFEVSYVKKNYNCDAYSYQFNEMIIEYVAYYLTMFSHQRETENWKGIVQLEFSESSENEAKEFLLERSRLWR